LLRQRRGQHRSHGESDHRHGGRRILDDVVPADPARKRARLALQLLDRESHVVSFRALPQRL
jgi:hypothetical protein